MVIVQLDLQAVDGDGVYCDSNDGDSGVVKGILGVRRRACWC